MAGFVGEQFALPEAVELLRRVNNQEPDGQWIVVSACDPLNLVGILTLGEKVTATPGNRVAFKDGVPMCSLENGELNMRAQSDEAMLAKAQSLLRPALHETIDGEGNANAPGFRRRARTSVSR